MCSLLFGGMEQSERCDFPYLFSFHASSWLMCFFSSSVCVLVKGRNFTRAYLSIVKKLLRLLFFFYFCVSKFTFKNSLFLLVFAIFLLALNYHHHHLIDFCYFDFPFFVLGCFVPV